MDYNIDNLSISENEKVKKRDEVTRHCLLGVEFEPSMFALAYTEQFAVSLVDRVCIRADISRLINMLVE